MNNAKNVIDLVTDDSDGHASPTCTVSRVWAHDVDGVVADDGDDVDAVDATTRRARSVARSADVRRTQPVSAASQDDFSCSICMEALVFNHAEHPTAALPCGHVFHANCIQLWFANGVRSECPHCRGRYAITDPKRASTVQLGGGRSLQLLHRPCETCTTHTQSDPTHDLRAVLSDHEAEVRHLKRSEARLNQRVTDLEQLLARARARNTAAEEALGTMKRRLKAHQEALEAYKMYDALDCVERGEALTAEQLSATDPRFANMMRKAEQYQKLSSTCTQQRQKIADMKKSELSRAHELAKVHIGKHENSVKQMKQRLEVERLSRLNAEAELAAERAATAQLRSELNQLRVKHRKERARSDCGSGGDAGAPPPRQQRQRSSGGGPVPCEGTGRLGWSMKHAELFSPVKENRSGASPRSGAVPGSVITNARVDKMMDDLTSDSCSLEADGTLCAKESTATGVSSTTRRTTPSTPTTPSGTSPIRRTLTSDPSAHIRPLSPFSSPRKIASTVTGSSRRAAEPEDAGMDVLCDPSSDDSDSEAPLMNPYHNCGRRGASRRMKKSPSLVSRKKISEFARGVPKRPKPQGNGPNNILAYVRSQKRRM